MAKTTTPDSDSPFVTLRNTISGVSQEYARADAERFLNHPTFGKCLVVVNSSKPEVLADPYTIGDDGEKVPVPAEEVADASVNGISEEANVSNGDIK